LDAGEDGEVLYWDYSADALDETELTKEWKKNRTLDNLHQGIMSFD
jgi:hypothetical protein